MKIVKRALAVGATVAALGALAVPAGAERPAGVGRPNTWVVNCAVGGAVTKAFPHSPTEVASYVRGCLEEGGRPARVEPGVFVF